MKFKGRFKNRENQFLECVIEAANEEAFISYIKENGLEAISYTVDKADYLICPSCREKNNPTFIECWSCGASLTEGVGSHGPKFSTDKSFMPNFPRWVWWLLLVIPLRLFALHNSEIAMKKDLSNLRNKFFVCMKNDDFNCAKTALEDALKIDNNDASTWDMLGNLRFTEGNVKGAFEAYNQAIKINPNYAHTYFDRGGVYMHLQQYKKALSDFEKAVALDPNYPDFKIALETAKKFVH